MRYAARMARCAASRKTRHRQIEAAPEEVDRARFAEEAGAELLEHAVGVHKDLQEAPHRIRIVRGVRDVLREANRLRQFVRHLVDGDVNAEVRKIGYHRSIEARHRLSGEGKLPLRAVAGGNAQSLVDEVEVD